MERNQIYKCPICGNIVEVTHVGGGQLVCCGQPMELLEEKTDHQEFSKEKHIPVIEKTDKGMVVKVGSMPHPMEEVHYIEFIEVITNDGKIDKKFLKPGDLPEAYLNIESDDIAYIRIYCNVHGLWINKL